MELDQYINQKKGLYVFLIKFIENGNDTYDNTYYQNLYQNLQDTKILEKRNELKDFLRTILKISKNHHRFTDFFRKFEKILLLVKDSIKQSFSNLEIFNIFKSNKLILLFLFQIDILVCDKIICDKILLKEDYSFYFYPEIKLIVKEEISQKIENKMLQMNPGIFEEFNIKRKIGENDSILCSLIRNDSIEELISYVNQTNLSLSSQIPESIFETNQFLIGKKPTLFEYAAFFRSIQIIKYLRKNNIELTSSLWLYSIHGRNQELINILKESQIEPENNSYQRCLEESIKCHHNDLANFILDNFLNKENEFRCDDNNFDENAVAYSFHYHNYLFMPKDFKNKSILCYLCRYGYYTFVDILLKTDKSMINSTIIH